MQPEHHEQAATTYQSDRVLFFEEYGSGGTPVLFLHGLAGSGRSWQKVAKEIASDRRVIVPDLLGFGRSPWPQAVYTVDDHITALDQLLEERGLLDGPFDIVGHSMGAILGAELAARHRDVVRRLVLVSLPYFKSEPDASAWVTGLGWLARMTLEGRWKGRLACRVMCTLRPVLKIMAPRFAPYLPGAIVRDFFQHNFTSISGSLNNVIVRHRLDAALEMLRQVPVTLVHGDIDRTAPLTPVAELVKAFPAWKLQVIAGGDHLLPIDMPGQIAESVREVCMPEMRSFGPIMKSAAEVSS